jgi:hypothetical protein
MTRGFGLLVKIIILAFFFICFVQVVNAEIVYQQNFDNMAPGTSPTGYEQYYSG